jgi:hypothetical protein
MSPSGDSYRVILLGAVLCVPLTLAEQNSPEVKIEKKPVHLPAGDGQKPFDVTRHLIPLTDVQSGGPAKDGIPALNHPAFTSAAEGDRVLNSSDTVLGALEGHTPADRGSVFQCRISTRLCQRPVR